MAKAQDETLCIAYERKVTPMGSSINARWVTEGDEGLQKKKLSGEEVRNNTIPRKDRIMLVCVAYRDLQEPRYQYSSISCM